MSGALIFCASIAAFPLPPRPPEPPPETVIRLSVRPTPAPKPALRHLLLPELSEMSPGNPIPNYMKCFLSEDLTAREESFGPAVLRQADRAARMDKPDWQILLRLREDGIELLLPDVQKMRSLAGALQGRYRGEIAARRIDDALTTNKTMFAMARHMGEHPTLIGELVGIAIANLAVGPLEELLEQPGCPNLYWALANLPSPLVSIDTGLDGERVFILAELRDLSDTAPMRPEQIKKVAARIDLIRKSESDKNDNSTRAWLSGRAKDAKYLAAARARLVEYGIPADRLARFPADQVVLLDEKREYEVRRDEATKFLKLPTWEAEACARKVVRAKEPALLDVYLSSFVKIRRAQGRLEQRIALLRHVEALRLYAADHAGNLPDKLADVDVPLPVDPFTGKPFRYAKDGDTAHLRGSPPPGEEKVAAYNVHYEITIRK